MSGQKRDRRDQYHDYYQRNKEAVNARHKARYAAKRDEILAKQREKRHAAKAAEEAHNPKPAPPSEPSKPPKPPKGYRLLPDWYIGADMWGHIYMHFECVRETDGREKRE